MIRPARGADWQVVVGMGFLDAHVEERFRAYCERDDHHLVVADDLVGYAWAQDSGPHLRAGFSIVRLHDLFVVERRRREGIGRALLEDVVEWARARGARYVQWHGGSASAGFYAALGVIPVPQDPTHPFYELDLEAS